MEINTYNIFIEVKSFLCTTLNISARIKGRISERILSKNETTFKTCISHNLAGIPSRKMKEKFQFIIMLQLYSSHIIPSKNCYSKMCNTLYSPSWTYRKNFRIVPTLTRVKWPIRTWRMSNKKIIPGCGPYLCKHTSIDMKNVLIALSK